jgi:hypothetical protein
MTKTHRTKANERLHAPAAETTTLDGGRASSASFERERQMVDFSIGYNGQHSAYKGYRYDLLADAVAYAQLMRSRPMQEDAGGRFSPASAPAPPTDTERSLMDSLAIDFRDGAYRFKGYRYDGLMDAVNYAKLSRQRQDKG